MITCKKATELLSRAHDEKLSLVARIGLSYHLRICHFCRSFRDHIRQIGVMAQSFRGDEGEHLPAPPEHLNEKLIEAIRKKMK